MCDERKVETIESLCSRLQELINDGYGDCKIKCFDGFLYNDAWGFDPIDKIYEIKGYYSDTNLGEKVRILEHKLKNVFEEYHNSINTTGEKL